MSAGWSFTAVGWPWWVGVPLACACAWGVGRLARRELASQPPRVARALAWLRRAAVAVVVLLLIEPTLTRTRVEAELPSVAVLLDRSGSMAIDDRQMAPTHRLDEAIALGYLDPAARPEAGSRAGRGLDAFCTDAPTVARALAAARDAWSRGESVDADHDVAEAIALAQERAAEAERVGAASNGLESLPELFAECAHVLRASATTLARPRTEIAGVPGDERPEALIAALDRCAERARDARGRADAAQEAADAALVGGAERGSAVANALADLARLGRWQRGSRFVGRTLIPALAGKADVHVFALDDELGEVPNGPDAPAPDERAATDFAAPLARLAREWSDKHVGAVVLVSDGRQTAGGDPLPLARALHARGALVAGVLVGDPRPPRDAVVAEIGGAQEVFRGERIRLDVRFRIVGFDQTDFDLSLTRDGQEVERRAVRGTGAWQTARFELPGEDGGVHVFRARLDPAPSPSQQAIAGRGGLLREVWTGVPGAELAQLSTAGAWLRAPNASDVVNEARALAIPADTGTRLRGWVVPPATGEYVFALTGDDQAELELSTNADPARKRRIAFVAAAVGHDDWQRAPEQTSAPITLSAGAPYYLEAIVKQAGGDGFVAAGWRRPDGQTERPIAGANLAPWRDGPLPGGAGTDQPEASLANNQAECTVTINDDPLRVLVADATPRWDARYLVAMLERDRRVQVTRRYRSVLAALPGAESARIVPATQPELDQYDLVVLGDLAPSDLGASEQAMIEQFVARRGGFLVCIAGTRAMPAAYPLGALADVLPVRAGRAAETVAPTTVALTQPGAEHPITTLLDDPKMNQRLWPALPPLDWYASAVTAKASATVLVEAQDQGRSPLVAASRYGAGRVLWVGTDETWRWRASLGDRVHQSFWLQAVRWGLGARLRGKDPRLQAALDRALLEPGEGCELRARARLADGTPIVDAPLSAVIQRLDEQGNPQPGVRRQVELGRIADADVWSTQFGGLGEGRYRITVTCAHPELAGLEETRDVVVRRARSIEGIELGADAAYLERIAQAGGSRSAGLKRGAELVDELARRLKPRDRAQVAVITLWDNYGALSLVLGLLLAEWIWRKRRGLP